MEWRWRYVCLDEWDGMGWYGMGWDGLTGVRGGRVEITNQMIESDQPGFKIKKSKIKNIRIV